MQKNMWLRLIVPLLLAVIACNMPGLSSMIPGTPTPEESESTEEAPTETPLTPLVEDITATGEASEEEEATETSEPTETPPPPTATPWPYVAPAATSGPSPTPKPTDVVCIGSWFFSNGPTDKCPSDIETSYGVYEHFEGGLMVWVEDSDMIYIFFLNQEIWPPYTIHIDPWHPDGLESDPAIKPPGGLYQPVRGFGMLWRNDGDFEFDNFRERLGWATEPEKAFDVTIQCDTTPDTPTCYMSGPDSVIEMLPGRSGWSGLTGSPTPTPTTSS